MFYLIDLLYGMMVPSGNDAALTLAENFGDYLLYERMNGIKLNFNVHDFDLIPQLATNDSLNAFLKEMNRFAQKLKLLGTNYANPHGLSNPLNRSTAYD